ncbi:MAG: redoxin domain-containing protein [Verrucomicrobia bacterium]|nr:redoxin domain-containing protein [Verrucomicrobiota bacterium]
MSALTVTAKGLELGASAPTLTVVDDRGESIDFGAELAAGTTVVFFYPMASTPGCTKQACSLGAGFMELRSRGVKVFGVSGDGVEGQRKFREKYSLPFPLIADKDLRVNKAFGKKRFARQVYIFRNGKLVWRDLSASTGKQYEDVIAALDSLDLKN